MREAYFNDYFLGLHELTQTIDDELAVQFISQLNAVRARKGKVIIVGNGGSAAIASHVAIDLSKAAGIRAMTLNDSSVITCLANDYGYENWVTKGLEIYMDAFDFAILISSRGESPNIVKAAEFLNSVNYDFVSFSGFSSANSLRSASPRDFWVDSDKYNFVENTHQIWLLALIDRYIVETTM